MSDSIGKMIVSLEGNIVAFRESMDQAQVIAKEAMAGVSESIEKGKKALELFGVGFAVHELKEMGKAALEAGEQLEILSQKSGLSVEQLSTLKFAGQLTGVTLESLATGLKKLSVDMEDSLSTKGGKGAQALKALGVNAKDSSGNLRSANDVMLDIAERFHAMEDGAGKAAIAVALFGRNGVDMIPLLNEGKEGIARMKKEADALGITMGGEYAKQAKEFNDNLTRLSESSKALARSIVADMLPGMQEFTDAIIQAKKESGGLLAWWIALGRIGQNIIWVTPEQKETLDGVNNQIAALQKTIDRLKQEDSRFEGGILGRLVSGTTADKLKEAEQLMARLQEVRSKLQMPVVAPQSEGGAKEQPPVLPDMSLLNREQSYLAALHEQLNRAHGDLSEYSKVLNDFKNGAAKDFDKVTRAAALSLAKQIDVFREATKANEEHARVLAKVDEIQREATKTVDDFTLKQKQAADAVRTKIAEIGMTAEQVAIKEALAAIEKEAETAVQHITQTLGKLGDIEGINEAVGKIMQEAESREKERTQLIRADYAQRNDFYNGMKNALNSYADSMTPALQANKLYTDSLKGMEDALVQFVKTGKLNFTSLANSIITDMIRIMVQSNITKPLANALGGMDLGLGSLFSSFSFGGGKASGGTVSAGMSYLVGEQGPEILRMGYQSGKIVPNDALGGTTNTYYIDATGADPAAIQRLEATIRSMNGSIERRAVAAALNSRRREPAAWGVA